MGLTATLNPSNFGLGGQGGIPSEDNVIWTYKAAASTSYSKGDFVKLSDSTNGYIGKVSATGDSMIGVVATDVDNSSGSAGDKYVPVVRKGVVEVDAIVAASGLLSATIFHDSLLYLNHANTSPTVSAGTALTSTNTGGIVVGSALDSVPVPTSSAVYRMRVFIDRLNDLIN